MISHRYHRLSKIKYIYVLRFITSIIYCVGKGTAPGNGIGCPGALG